MSGRRPRVATNVLLRDLDLAVTVVQLAVDATLVSPLHCDGTARPGSAHVDGAVLAVACRRKERTYQELLGRQARKPLVLLAGEIGGRWSAETSTFVRLLAKARARS